LWYVELEKQWQISFRFMQDSSLCKNGMCGLIDGDAPVQQIPTENKHQLEVGNTTGIWQSGQRGEPRGGNLGIFSSWV